MKGSTKGIKLLLEVIVSIVGGITIMTYVANDVFHVTSFRTGTGFIGAVVGLLAALDLGGYFNKQ